jgi:hypothetical protein
VGEEGGGVGLRQLGEKFFELFSVFDGGLDGFELVFRDMGGDVSSVFPFLDVMTGDDCPIGQGFLVLGEFSRGGLWDGMDVGEDVLPAPGCGVWFFHKSYYTSFYFRKQQVFEGACKKILYTRRHPCQRHQQG